MYSVCIYIAESSWLLRFDFLSMSVMGGGGFQKSVDGVGGWGELYPKTF